MDTSPPHHVLSGTAFRKAKQAASRQGSWSSLTIYCLHESLPLHRGRARPGAKSCQAQAASSCNCSSGCICVVWDKSSALVKTLQCQQTQGNLPWHHPPPGVTWVTGRLSLLPHRLVDIQGTELHPAARENTWWYQVYVLMCSGLLYTQWETLKSAGN